MAKIDQTKNIRFGFKFDHRKRPLWKKIKYYILASVNFTFNRFENGNQFDHALFCCHAIKNYEVKTAIGSYKFINKLENTIFISLTLRCGKNKTCGCLCAFTSSRSERESLLFSRISHKTDCSLFLAL